MRRLILLSAFLVAPLLPTQAAAINLPTETRIQLDFVATTELRVPGAAQPIALCRASEATTLAGLPVWQGAARYVLSETRCESDAYFERPNLIEAGFADGRIPADVPRIAGFSPAERLSGNALPVLAGLLLALVTLRMLFRKRQSRVEQRQEVLGLSSGPVFRFIDVMLHAARADGEAQPEEIAYIQEKARSLTQLDYSAEHIEWAIQRTEKLRSPRDFRIFAQGLTPEQARMVLRAALAVVAADGEMTRAERRFISQLTTGLSLDPAEIDKVIGPQADLVAA